jgi:acetoin utilization protein AcuB
MNVKSRMTPDPITTTPGVSHSEALRIMRENHIEQLPVLNKKGKLIGIISMADLLSSAPSSATSLSIYEIYTLLDKLKVKQIMARPVYAIDEATSLAGAARFMFEKDIGSLPVVRDGELVGIITKSDIFKTFVEILAGGEPGCRVDLRVPDVSGILAMVAQAFTDAGGDIKSMVTFRADDPDYGVLSFKEEGADEDKLRSLLSEMPNVTVTEFRASGGDQLLEFGG